MIVTPTPQNKIALRGPSDFEYAIGTIKCIDEEGASGSKYRTALILGLIC